MSKIENDKYYTPTKLANELINKTFEIIGKENISDIIEPSAGDGAFSLLLPDCKAYDIEPEHESILKQDYLKLDVEYKKGRLIIGNPPFGEKFNLAYQFYLKSIQIADYIAFILPISQLNNNIKLYQFDLIYSIDLGLKDYSGKYIHCCFNIYKRPDNNILNTKPNYKLKDIDIIGVSRTKKNQQPIPSSYNYSFVGFGGSAGKECNGNELKHCEQVYITVNQPEYIDKIKELIINTKWFEIYPSIGTKRLKVWQLYKHIKLTYPELN